MRVASSDQPGARGLKAVDVVLLGAAAGYWPLAVLAANVVGNTHPERVLMFVAAVWGTAIAASCLLVTVGLRRTIVVPGVFLAVVLAMSGGRLFRELGNALGWAAIIALLGIWLLLVVRMEGSVLIASLIAGLAVALFSGSVISLANTVLGWGESKIVATPGPAVGLIERPDIFVVVLDGYPGLVTLAEEWGDDKDRLLSSLEMAGFQTPRSAWSSYWATALAIPSVLEMSYPVEEAADGEATIQDLYKVVSGDSALVAILRSHGYSSYMVESGWSGSSCSSGFDNCVAAPFIDESMYITLSDTILGDGVDEMLGHPFTLGTEQTMDWLRQHGPLLSNDGEPSLVFAHLVAPHPPFYLDASCRRVVSKDRAGSGLFKRGVPDAVREAYFSDQMACVDDFMVELADLLNPESVVVFVSDHGTDRRRQLNLPAESWERSHMSERFNVFASIRVRPGCDFGEVLVLPNTMRLVLSCYAAEDIQPLPARMFMPGMVEVDTSTVEALLDPKGLNR